MGGPVATSKATGPSSLVFGRHADPVADRECPNSPHPAGLEGLSRDELSFVWDRALDPTAKMSRWYIDVLQQLDGLVFPDDLGPYAERQRLDEQTFGRKGAVLELTAHTFPLATGILWIALGGLYLAANYWFKITP
jgi:hypothetical protein